MNRLAEALTDLIHACEHYPRPQTGEPPGRDDRFDAAQLRVIRAASLSMLGLSADVSEPVLELLDPNAWRDPDRTMKYATAAYERLWDEADRLKLGGHKAAHNGPSAPRLRSRQDC